MPIFCANTNNFARSFSKTTKYNKIMFCKRNNNNIRIYIIVIKKIYICRIFSICLIIYYYYYTSYD